jgi:hypothetical protein
VPLSQRMSPWNCHPHRPHRPGKGERREGRLRKARKETTITMRYCSCIKLEGGHEAALANSQIPILRWTRNRPAAGESHQVDQPLGKFLVLSVVPLWKLGHTCLALNTSSAYWTTNIPNKLILPSYFDFKYLCFMHLTFQIMKYFT